MPAKIIELPGIGPVHLYKRRGARNIRISINAEGKVRVSLPMFVPYKTAVEFTLSKANWISNSLADRPTSYLRHGSRIGKAHQIAFKPAVSASRITTRVVANEVRVTYPMHLPIQDHALQAAARNAGVRALRQQAEQLLPPRLRQLARQYSFSYRSVGVKQLKSRWGSCDSRGNIALNLFLMQLPWQLIDYVLIHELVHTKYMNHGADFWAEFEGCLPNAKQLRRDIRRYQALLLPGASLVPEPA